jgi:hypothetical protein
MSTKIRSAAQIRQPKKQAKGKLSLHPLTLKIALGAAIATGPIPVGDRKPKPKKKGK